MLFMIDEDYLQYGVTALALTLTIDCSKHDYMVRQLLIHHDSQRMGIAAVKTVEDDLEKRNRMSCGCLEWTHR